MSGPWEQYQSAPQAPAQEGPWSQFQPPAAQQPGWLDAVKSAASGLVQGVAPVIDAANPFSGFTQAAEAAAQAVGHPIPQNVQQWLPGGAQQLVTNHGGNYQPQTTVGRYAKSVASMAPAAAMGPEGLIPKIASVVIPGLAAQGAADATGAMGGDSGAQDIARFAGGVVGGGLASAVPGAVPAAAEAAPLSIEEHPVVKAIQAALDVGGTDPAELDAKLARGVLPVAADPGLQQLGETVATLPGQGGVAIRNAAQARLGDVSDRVMQAAQDTLGVDPQAARGGVDAIVAKGQAQAAPLYDQFRNTPGPLWNSELAEIAQRPSIKKAIATAAAGLQDAGQTPFSMGFRFDPDTGWELNGTTSAVSPETGGVVPQEAQLENQPTRATWDAVYKGIGDAVDRNPFTNRPLQNGNNFNLDVARQALKGALTSADPVYGQALATSSDYLGVNNVFNKISGKALSGATSVYDFNKLWSGLNGDAEQSAARSAVMNDLLEQVDKGKFAPQLFKTPGVQQKLAIAFGPDAASSFTDQMMNEFQERAAYNKITQGSPTAGRDALIRQYAANNPPKGIGAVLGKATDIADTVASFSHPVTAMTRAARMATHLKSGGGGASGVPWDEDTTAQLGQILSDPTQFRGLLSRMALQKQFDQAGPGALGTFQKYAVPAGFSGALASSPGLATAGQTTGGPQ